MTDPVLNELWPYLLALALLVPLIVWACYKLIPSDDPSAKSEPSPETYEPDFDPSYHDEAGHYGIKR